MHHVEGSRKHAFCRSIRRNIDTEINSKAEINNRKSFFFQSSTERTKEIALVLAINFHSPQKYAVVLKDWKPETRADAAKIAGVRFSNREKTSTSGLGGLEFLIIIFKKVADFPLTLFISNH